MKYACIAQHRDSYPVTLMCRVLDVARTGFYAWRRRHFVTHGPVVLSEPEWGRDEE